MAEFFLTDINLTQKQLERLGEAHSENVNGFMYSEGKLFLNCKKDSLTDGEKAKIISDVQKIPDEETPRIKRIEELSEKQTLTIDELTELLKAKNVI